MPLGAYFYNYERSFFTFGVRSWSQRDGSSHIRNDKSKQKLTFLCRFLDQIGSEEIHAIASDSCLGNPYCRNLKLNLQLEPLAENLGPNKKMRFVNVDLSRGQSSGQSSVYFAVIFRLSILQKQPLRYLFAEDIIELAFDRSVNIRPSNGFKWLVFECINT